MPIRALAARMTLPDFLPLRPLHAALTADERKQDSTAKLRKFTELLLSLLRLVPNPNPTSNARLTSGAASPRPALVWLGISARGEGAPAGTAGSRRYDAVPAWRPVLEQHGVALVSAPAGLLCLCPCDVLCCVMSCPCLLCPAHARFRWLQLRCRFLRPSALLGCAARSCCHSGTEACVNTIPLREHATAIYMQRCPWSTPWVRFYPRTCAASSGRTGRTPRGAPSGARATCAAQLLRRAAPHFTVTAAVVVLLRFC